jgi:hypothetical protein
MVALIFRESTRALVELGGTVEVGGCEPMRESEATSIANNLKRGVPPKTQMGGEFTRFPELSLTRARLYPNSQS